MSTVKKLDTCSVIPAINLFVTNRCNMRCRFCFGSCKMSSSLSPQDQEDVFSDVIKQCYLAGISKVTFVGGEPLLYPKLERLIRLAHSFGITTCVVTNGVLVTNEWLSRVTDVLDWIGVSIDSLSVNTNQLIGRVSCGGPMSEHDYRRLVDWVHESEISLKINTTVCQWNYEEDMSSFYHYSGAQRIKMFQALTIAGVNDEESKEFSVSNEHFLRYIERHRHEKVDVVAECSSDMVGSYLMVSPDGRFFDNVNKGYRFSRSIREVGLSNALKDISVDHDKFVKRGGLYSWQN